MVLFLVIFHDLTFGLAHQGYFLRELSFFNGRGLSVCGGGPECFELVKGGGTSFLFSVSKGGDQIFLRIKEDQNVREMFFDWGRGDQNFFPKPKGGPEFFAI